MAEAAKIHSKSLPFLPPTLLA